MNLFKITFFYFFLVAARPLFATTNCTQKIDSCDFYQCVSRELYCYNKDYPLAYGYKYCQRFKTLKQLQYSSVLNRWIDETRVCLMSSLDEFWTTNSCKTIAKPAFESHASCYVDSGFCDLNDKEKKLVLTFALDGLFNRYSIISFLKFRNACR